MPRIHMQPQCILKQGGNPLFEGIVSVPSHTVLMDQCDKCSIHRTNRKHNTSMQKLCSNPATKEPTLSQHASTTINTMPTHLIPRNCASETGGADNGPGISSLCQLGYPPSSTAIAPAKVEQTINCRRDIRNWIRNSKSLMFFSD